MVSMIETDLCVIGAGSGGLSVAAGASQMGARTVLVEGGKMGGDCLNYGCVPSKALIAASHHADRWRAASAFGLSASAPTVDFAAVMDHVQDVISGIAPMDSQERFEALGVQVIRATGRFVDDRTLAAGDVHVRARRFVIATGSRPAIPAIPGLADVPVLTNETVFANRDQPEHLIVIGGGPIGCELAQAHRRLGSAVTVLDAGRILGRDDPELAEFVRRRLIADGVALYEDARIEHVTMDQGRPMVVMEGGERLVGSHLLVAAGRAPNVESLNLQAAGVQTGPRGIAVDKRLRTANRRIFAIGDVTGLAPFTHMAGYHAGIVIRNILFRLPAKVRDDATPWCTYSDPELAWVGLQEEQARRASPKINVLRWSFGENDRASAERLGEGMVKIITTPAGRILGAGIVGPHAGELIGIWALAVTKRMKIGDIAGTVLPYPTLGEASKRAAGSFYAPKLFSARTRRIVRFLLRLG